MSISYLSRWVDDPYADDLDPTPLFAKIVGHNPIKGTPFSETDLIIFKDSYSGLLPSNGILLKDFNKIKNILENINSTASPISIQGSEPFVNSIKSDIAKILTRQLGRDLFNELLGSGEKIQINEGAKCESCVSMQTITMTLEDHLVPVRNKEGRQVFGRLPRFIALAHELIHQHHDQSLYQIISRTDFYESVKVLRPDLDNPEEQITIIGWVKDNIFEGLSEHDEDDWSTESYEKQIGDYYFRINENLFQSSFFLPIRPSHRGAQSFNPTLSEMVYCGTDQSLEEALADKGIGELSLSHPGWSSDLDDSKIKAYVGRTPLTTAIATNNKALTEYLLQQGAPFDQADARGDTPLQVAIKKKNYPLILLLLNHHPQLFAQDPNSLQSLFRYHYTLHHETPTKEQMLDKVVIDNIADNIKPNIDTKVLLNVLEKRDLDLAAHLISLGSFSPLDGVELAVAAIKADAMPYWLRKNIKPLQIDWTRPNASGDTALSQARSKAAIRFLVEECHVPSNSEIDELLKSDELELC